VTDRDTRKQRRQRLKALQQTRRSRARNSVRIVKYGVKGLARNSWLTLAAILVMTISLVIVSATAVSRFILNDTVDQLKSSIELSIYLDHDTGRDAVEQIVGKIGTMQSVASIRLTSPDAAKEEEIARLRDKTDNTDIVDAAIEAPNLFPWIINVAMVDLSHTDELNWYLANDPTVVNHLDDLESSSNRTDRVEAINKITDTTQFIERLGIILGVVFAIVAALIIFNTIRMAIFSRKEEIYMMKLVGAGKSFIRGPFLIEAMMYGVISAGITVGLVVGGLYLIEIPLARYGVVVEPTLQLIREYLWVAILGVMTLGGLIGIISAMLAARQYLRVK
jgi:cell division transport system permease protein